MTTATLYPAPQAGLDAIPAEFPFDLSSYRDVALDPSNPTLTDQQRDDLKFNVDLCRDVITFFTAYAGQRGLSGHSGGPFDTVPEVVIIRAFVEHAKQGGSPKVMDVYWDEAGHRVATQYLIAALNGELPVTKLFRYREYAQHLPGHPERGFTPGVKFSSGRLGHMWPFVNGAAMAHPYHVVFMLGSDGSQQEGNDAEAARLAVAQGLNVKLLIDDNDVTIAGHPSDYMPGYDVAKTLEGHGLGVTTGDGENLDELYQRMCTAVQVDGPVALINKRPMAPGVPGVEGTTHGHDVFKTADAIAYLEKRGTPEATKAIELLNAAPKVDKKPHYAGSTEEVDANRGLFGKVMVEVLEKMDPAERKRTVKVFDCDLEGSTGINAIHKAFPEIYISGGIMERGNYSAAAGFGFDADKQGVFATFSAFLEMCVSEITMARLNQCNVLAHFSHGGVDDMADNTCHFGINHLFADGGLDSHDGTTKDNTRLYFPGDPNHFRACVKTVFDDKGLRFVFSNRSKLPYILKEDGSKFYDDASFTPGKDDIIREAGKATGGARQPMGGYVVSYGSTLHRSLAAVDQLRGEGVGVGLIAKATLNVYDEEVMDTLTQAPYVLVAEELNVKTGLGSRFGSELLKRGFTGKFLNIGTHMEGSGGLWRQMGFQGLDPEGIAKAIKTIA
ncbi:MAG: transketolase C-terminal domain-containing protein [Planctomycetota bacterium]